MKTAPSKRCLSNSYFHSWSSLSQAGEFFIDFPSLSNIQFVISVCPLNHQSLLLLGMLLPHTLVFGSSKITADGDCSHEIKRCLLLGRKVMTNLDSVLKSRDITLSTKVHLVKAMIFPVVMYGCESWTIKKAECRRIDAFELWRWITVSRT